MNDHAKASELLAKVLETLERDDIYAAIEWLDPQPPLIAAEVYDKAQRELYWKCKNVTAVVAMSQAGIQHSLTAALRSEDAEAARTLRGRAKTLAYNLASFTWPGWDEKGIALTTSDIAVGLEAARLNLRLAETLDRPEKAKANAHWMLGAQRLAAESYSPATEAFNNGKTHAERANEPLLGQMLDGYLALTDVLASPDDATAREASDRAVDDLKRIPSQDAHMYAEQLLTARAVFSGHAA